MKNYKFGVVVGRFQPLHNGHCTVIDLALANCERVAVFVGSAQEAYTEKNPFNYVLRKRLLREQYGSSIEIYPLNDLTDGSKVTGEWGKYLLREIYNATGAYPDVFFSGAEPIREKWFYPGDIEGIDEITVNRNILPVCATFIRDAILKNDYDAVCRNVPLKTLHFYDTMREILKNIQEGRYE